MPEQEIAGPTSPRLRLLVAPLAPGPDGRRLRLRQWRDRGEARENELVLCAGDIETARHLERVARSETGRLARLGSRARYRQELRAARACLADLGWTLSDEEEQVMAPLEEYAHRPDPRSRLG